MKTLVLSLLAVISLGTSSFGQQIYLDNVWNTGDQSATSNGRIFMPNGSLFDGYNKNLGVEVYAGADIFTQSLLGIFTAATTPQEYTGYDTGLFLLSSEAYVVPGISPGDLATITLNIWYDDVGGYFQVLRMRKPAGDWLPRPPLKIPPVVMMPRRPLCLNRYIPCLQ